MTGLLIAVAAVALTVPSGSRAAAPRTWLAAGDSYSSGEGLPHATGPCARAQPSSGSQAWPFAAYADLGASKPLSTPDLVACTGAKTSQFFSATGGKPSTPPEWQKSMGQFDLVSFTFGGDDLGFASFLKQCLLVPTLGRSCPSESATRKRIASLGNDYKTFLTGVAKQAVKPGGNILVLGYPEIIELPSLWSKRGRITGCGHFTVSNANEVRGLAADLNATIGGAVRAVNQQLPNGVHLTFVDVVSGGSVGIARNDPNLFEPSVGPRHEICSRKPWMNSLSTIDLGSGSYHPKQAGLDAEGQLAADAIKQMTWTPPPPPPPTPCAGSLVVYPGVGDVTITGIQSRGVACADAKAAITRYEQDRPPSFQINGQGFQCERHPIGDPGNTTYQTTCTRGTQVVTWQAEAAI